MTDTLTRTIDTIVETATNVQAEATQVVEEVSKNWNFLASFWGYWFPAILIISTAFFFRRFMFSNSSISYSVSLGTRDKDMDIRFRNIYVLLAIIIGLCPYANWVLLGVLVIFCTALGSEGMFPFYLNYDKFFADRLMNFLFNGEMDKPQPKVSKTKNSMKDL